MIATNIKNIYARQIFDSRGNPTVEADVHLESGAFGRAAVPSGASTGSHEAIELRDGDEDFGGKGVLKAVANVLTKIKPALIGKDARDQRAIDSLMIELDGTENKSNLGANAILAVSLAVAKAVANNDKVNLYEHIADIAKNDSFSLPMPMMNVCNGGAHADWATDIQEYMIIPIGANTIYDAMKMGTTVFHNLAKVLKANDYKTTVGDEGGFAPAYRDQDNEEPLKLIIQAIEKSGYTPGKDIALGLDVASSEFYKDGKYHLNQGKNVLDTKAMIAFLKELTERYPIISIEDGLAEEDWDGWVELQKELGDHIQLVGDDLLVTNVKRLEKAIDLEACNSILIKPNQIGSLSETIDAVLLAKKNNMTTIISHRSGETEDTTISHIAVGLNAGQIKTGSMSRTDRMAKYNELLRISETNPHILLNHLETK